MHQLLNLFSHQRRENRFMAGFRNSSLNIVVKQGIFDIISDYISYCCSEMEKDLRNKGRMIKNDENKIRDYLLEHFLNDNDLRQQMHMEMFLFIPEVPENYVDLEKYKGRVDIKIIHQLETFVEKSLTEKMKIKSFKKITIIRYRSNTKISLPKSKINMKMKMRLIEYQKR